jgi:hypothetical protein
MSIQYNNDNTIIFSLARMNPPTPGHMFLIETLIREAIDKNVGLSKQEFDDIVKSQLDIELQKKETEKVKIFMGVGLGLVTLLILFKLKNKVLWQ